MRRLLAILAFGLLCVGAVLGPSPSDKAVAQSAVPEDDAAKVAFLALPEPDRRAIQDALIWTGDYASVVTGGYGPRTRDAIAAYATRRKLSPAALLDAAPRKALLAAAQAMRQAVGFGPVRDKRTGLMLSLPSRLLGKETTTSVGTRYASTDGAIVVDTLVRPAGDGGLQDVFDRMSAASPQRKITYKLLKPDFFVVSGEIGDKKFYSRYALGVAGEATEIRGFTLAYPKDASARLDPIALATAASFDAFPGVSGAPGAPSPPATVAAGTPPHAAASADQQAIMVGPGLALAVLSSRTCPNPTLDKAPATYRAEDAASGLALLDVPGRPAPSLALATAGLADGTSVVALFTAKPSGLYAAPGQVERSAGEDFGLNAPLQSDSRGTPVFDRTGALVGLTAAGKAPPTIAGTVLQADYRVTGARPIAKLLDGAGVAHAPSAGTANLSFGDIVTARRAMLVVLSCAK